MAAGTGPALAAGRGPGGGGARRLARRRRRVLYAHGILWGLTTLWSAAVGNSALRFHLTAPTLAGGGAAAIVIGAAVMWLALRAQTRRPARELLEQGNELETQSALAKGGRRWAGCVAAASFLGALALAGSALGKHDSSAVESFFGGGALLLVAGIAGAAVWFRTLAEPRLSKPLSLAELGVRSCARQRKRSLATVALLASGSFLIIAVEANKLDARQQTGAPSSGTGGFAFIGESAFPVMQDLNTKEGRDFFALNQPVLDKTEFVQLRVRDGDDASCLNLNRALSPRLLGSSRNCWTRGTPSLSAPWRTRRWRNAPGPHCKPAPNHTRMKSRRLGMKRPSNGRWAKRSATRWITPMSMGIRSRCGS